MADTVNIPVPEDQPWFSLVTGGCGYITAGQSLTFVVSSSAPPETLFGHRINPDDTMEYSLSDDESIWVKSTENCVVVHTRSDVP
ncbi:hypothetical protein D3C77_28490 [compost metagenome]